MPPSTSLLQGVLRPSSQLSPSSPSPPPSRDSPSGFTDNDSRRNVQVDHLAAMMGRIEVKTPVSSRPQTPENGGDKDSSDSDDEIIGVQTAPGTPRADSRTPSRPSSRPSSRAASPSRLGASTRKAPGPLILGVRNGLASATAKDPLKTLPTDVNQKIFGMLSTRELAKCARVCKRWKRSQTFNYVWFQHYRKDNFQDDSLPPGKWSRRESKQDWRYTYLNIQRRSDLNGPRLANDATAMSSGYQTPKELKEAQWAAEAQPSAKPNKVEMRVIYKELGGRKSKGKGKFGGTEGARDRGGWAGGGEGDL